jgi:hypothetical protein
VPQRITHRKKVKRFIRQWNIFRSTLHKPCVEFMPCDGEHTGARIQTGDVFRGAQDLNRFNRDQASSATNVQQPVAWTQSMLEQCQPAVSTPGSEETPGIDTVVVLSAAIEELIYKIRLLRLSLEPRLYYRMGQHALLGPRQASTYRSSFLLAGKVIYLAPEAQPG